MSNYIFLKLHIDSEEYSWIESLFKLTKIKEKKGFYNHETDLIKAH